MTAADMHAVIKQALDAQAKGRPAEAEAQIRVGIAAWPGNAQLHFALAQALTQQNKLEAAMRELQEAIKLCPHFPQALNYLGLVYVDLKRPEEALASFRAAVAQKPDYVRAWNNLSNVLREQGDLPAAALAIGEAVRLQPDYALGHYNLGIVLKDLGRLEEAAVSLTRATELAPAHRYAHVALAGVLRQLGKLDEAVGSYTHAIELDPDESASEYAALGSTLAERGEARQAIEVYRRSRSRFCDNLRLMLGAYLTLPIIPNSRDELLEARAEYARGIERLRVELPAAAASMDADTLLGQLEWSNFYLAYQGEDDSTLQRQYSDVVGAAIEAVAPELRAPMVRSRGAARIRIGFLSNFFTESTVGMYFQSWITQLDRTRFEVTVYHLKPGTDTVAQKLRQHADHFVHFGGGRRRIPAIARAVRADALDILVYPELGMDASCFLLAALRLAPVQVAGWGHPVTTGHSNVDVFLSSDGMELAEAQNHYRERLIRLPGLGTAYPSPIASRAAGASHWRTRRELGLPENRTLYLCPQSPFKIHPDNDRLLARIICADPQGTLLLFNARHPALTDRFMRRLGRAFAELGEDIRMRSLVLPYLTHDDYLQINAVADVMLDTVHWSGGNTSLDALACGLPIVTLPGRFMRGRQTAGMLQLLGVTETIAADQDQYVAIATRLAHEHEWRTQLTQRIRDGHDSLFGDTAPIAQLQKHFEELCSAN